MPKNVFDQASRFAARLDPTGFLGWALNLPAGGCPFRGWLDVRGVAFPGGEERTGDTVARVDDPAANGVPWAVAVEFQTDPDPLMFGRLLGYLSGLWLSVKPDAERGSRYCVGAVVVNLTGVGTASRHFHWDAAGMTTRLGVVERNLERESADDLLGRIGTGERSRCLLPWIPLMTGGGEEGIVERWKREAEAEPDDRRRSEFAGLAKVFAEAARRKDLWVESLRGWNVKQSTVVSGWMDEGRAEGEIAARRAVVLELLEALFGAIPAEVTDRVRATADTDTLKRWLIAAGKADSLPGFRAAAGV